MKGVILFADNKILEVNTFENKLFERLNASTEYVVFPIKSVDALEEALKNVSTFKALILDWNFERDSTGIEDELGIQLPAVTPESLLLKTDIYSLIYVYSQNQISENIKSRLKVKFGSKIDFKIKGQEDKVDDHANSIFDDITTFENSNKHMEIPFVWSQAINKSVQEIFVELEQADPNWLKEIRDTAASDGVEPTSEVIDIFHHILNESLIQNKSLRDALNAYQCDVAAIAEENTAKLYRRIFYSKLHEDAPLMTGDIFKFSEKEYGILITPECEVENRKDSCLEFLIFQEDDINIFLNSSYSYKRGIDQYTEKKGKSLKKIYNNDTISSHILPSFPFSSESCNKSASINFKSAFSIRTPEDYADKRIGYKLNAPYIHQLGQRYVSFFGKYGVPATPDSLRVYNLK